MRCAIFLLALTCGALASPVEEDALQEFINGNRKFTAAVYQKLLAEENGNFIMSPFSAETVLALTNEGARGKTAQELVSGLSLPSTNHKTQQVFKSFLPKLKTADEDLKLQAANKIYVGNDVKLESDFRSIAENVYNSGVENINFAKNVEAAGSINQWVEDQTNNKIKDLIDPDSIDSDTKLVLVNALYFSGQWDYQFEEYETSKKKFYKTATDSVEVDTMHQIEYFNYYENPTLNAKFLELPFKGGNVSMVIVLPNEREGLSALEKNVEQLLEPQPFKRERVDLLLPKFKTETTIKFVPILKSLGIRDAFDESRSNFSGLSSTHKNLVISDVIQKAFIDLNEKGVEAAAATAVLVEERTLRFYKNDPIPFHVNHPFLYSIRYNGITLFTGSYKQAK